MKTATEIVRPAPYGRMHVWCKKHQSRHAIDKPCDASIEAYRLEFEAEVRETKRKADRDYYKKKKDEEKQHASELTTVENIRESIEALIEEDDDDDLIENEKPSPYVLERAFWYRVLKATDHAKSNYLNDLEITQEMVDAVKEAAETWTKRLKQVETYKRWKQMERDTLRRPQNGTSNGNPT